MVPNLGSCACWGIMRAALRDRSTGSSVSFRMSVPHFHIKESREPGPLRLTLAGELDLASAPDLEARLRQLKDTRQTVCLDLSALEFIDSTGIRVLLQTVQDARSDGWDLRVADELTPGVRRVLELVQLDRYIVGDGDNGR